LKACPYDNLRLSTRRPFTDFLRDIKPRAAHVGFILLMSGFVVYEILSEWPVSKAILTWVPNQLAIALGITGSLTGFVSAIVMFIMFPAALFLVVTALAKNTSGGRVTSFGAIVKTFAVLLLPTMAGAHIIKSLLKMTSRIPYWSHTFSDPKGVATAQKIVDGTLVLDKSVPDALYPAVSFAAVSLLLTALAATLTIFSRSAAVQKLHPGGRVVLLMGMLAYWSVFGLVIFEWRF
ncbi:MAG: hypothetical protein ACYTAO_07370, partial [Planctomycetota bacterium]